MADQKNQNQGSQDSQARTPQGRQSSQQPSSENLKDRDRNRDRDEERKKGSLSDLDRNKGAMDTRNEERDNLEGRSRTSAGSELRDDEDSDELNDDNRRGDRL